MYTFELFPVKLKTGRIIRKLNAMNKIILLFFVYVFLLNILVVLYSNYY